ncbi:phosphogluconate dehydrogenase (NAD(+)-dependent, decarboxylating) [Desulfoplanes formicivorans]|uniref:6-phosphogluconate dehydrogenase n=1 Tax=Desulfoplanes formicivorans TaxID=1592317 RepID=A0A194AIR9_9BACT|nr:decarboxylating 6-phosphogluconate dehydrogenase [Desulfoplanes formicivorans]GAU09223.1 6-phosphogluconate dehydrogenase [Desulfoplanes formicivorans]
MDIGIVGLGRMGMNIAGRLLGAGHRVVAWNRTHSKVEEIVTQGAIPCERLVDLKTLLPVPRIVWIMLPAGNPTEQIVNSLAEILEPGDMIIDGGNTNYQDDLRRSRSLNTQQIAYVDIGVSGGIWGRKLGFCLMVGGNPSDFETLMPILDDLAAQDGYMFCGDHGAGHFVKMIHNGIEYGMMQAYAEGFNLLEHSPYGPTLDYQALSHLWNQGSVIRSWLLELAEQGFADDPKLTKVRAFVQDSGEGKWAIQHALASSTPAPVLTMALMERFRSREENSFADRLLATLRNRFGGHAVFPADSEK